MNREFEIGQAGFEQIDRPAGVNRPDDAVLLQFLDGLHAAAIEDRVGAMRDKRAIEVCAEEADFGGHWNGNLGFDFATAIRNGRRGALRRTSPLSQWRGQ